MRFICLFQFSTYSVSSTAFVTHIILLIYCYLHQRWTTWAVPHAAYVIRASMEYCTDMVVIGEMLRVLQFIYNFIYAVLFK